MRPKTILIAIAVIFLSAAAFLFLTKSNEIASEEIYSGGSPVAMQRPLYGLSPGVFSGLPGFPRDFNKMVSLYHSGEFSDELFFPEEYYLQPEFYPSFMGNGLKYWLEPATGYWAAHGYGSFPVKKTIAIKPGEKKAIAFFVHSGYGVRSFQGVALEIEGTNNSYVEAEVVEPSFLLGPNFPKFSNNWARKVLIKVFAKENASGEHNFKVRVVRPAQELSDKWSQTEKRYYDAADITTGRPLFEFNVQVV